ncbi:MAG: threonine synthase [Armatimonadetes bacterium]|nr:threonine synthase [Armatimonadota bacterium]
MPCGPWRGVIEAYRSLLPVTNRTPVVTLLEGNTPLLEAPALSRTLTGGRVRLLLKHEGLNPTGSFKDRGMTVAISRALEAGVRAVICASTGNTAASAAAYAARAGLLCVVVLPHGMIALGKLGQALIHGARVVPIQGNFDAALRLVREVVADRPVALVNSINPARIEGQKTAAFEICDALGDAPHYHAIPVGNAGNITAYWRGYRTYHAEGCTTRCPRMLGFQAAGAAPIVEGHVVPAPETVATAIRIGNPASWQGAVAARDESGGRIEKVTDEEILVAYRLLAEREGVFCEPASAASVAGVAQLARAGYFDTAPPEATVVCTLTGHGLKDPQTAVAALEPPAPVPAELDAVLVAIGF